MASEAQGNFGKRQAHFQEQEGPKHFHGKKRKSRGKWEEKVRVSKGKITAGTSKAQGWLVGPVFQSAGGSCLFLISIHYLPHLQLQFSAVLTTHVAPSMLNFFYFNPGGFLAFFSSAPPRPPVHRLTTTTVGRNKKNGSEILLSVISHSFTHYRRYIRPFLPLCP
ncbi:hypothetical protein ASPBRDRAFT_672401 [Aspergillus brasiliensis CBS 101740]|uniref:Uncharacterized protein n=1 Tax=Aspergillus brasiliensis (strain CBS 101740 / IMI 381727 / IBT 21946) TaxID=767769 RepID=A0A1L9UL97_ASPBC|nr:hypothetical protein ASPBRDRAFT_672401 [Aspergillus brasiliensis CBS 101740]